MARTNMASSIAASFVLVSLLLAAMFFFVPLRAHAAEVNARLGGGNALLRATTGQSQGLVRANPTSNLSVHLTAASTRGGQPETTPNEHSNTGGTTSSEQSDGENGADATSAGGAGGNGGNNGGSIAGNGGNGGDGGGASPGGWVRAGGAVSNANGVNMMNVTIIKISR